MSSSVDIMRSRAMSVAPIGTSTAFSARSAARLIGLRSSCLASAAFLAAAVSARETVLLASDFARRVAVERAALPRLAARVSAAFFAAVERLVAFVLRVVADFWPALLLPPLLLPPLLLPPLLLPPLLLPLLLLLEVVVSAMSQASSLRTKDISSKSLFMNSTTRTCVCKPRPGDP
jgi:hypothetical protein